MKNHIINWIRKFPQIRYFVVALLVVLTGVGIFSIGIGNESTQVALNEPEPEKSDTVTAHPLKNTAIDAYGLSLETFYADQATTEPVYYNLCVSGSSDEEITMTFESKEALELALKIVQEEALGDGYETQAKVQLTDEGFRVESTATKKYSLKGIINDYSLSTSGATSESPAGADLPEIVTPEILDGEEASLHFYEDVTIRPLVDKDANLVTAVEGAEILNRSNQQPATYEVQSGDSPYTIALEYDMSLEELYAINEGLEEKAKGLKVGDLVTVEVLQPKLSVVIEEEITYYDSIEKGIDYQEDDTIYKTVEKEADPGYDGTKEVRAIVQTMNGEEIGRIILEEKVVSEPKNALVLVGTKALPEVGPVGNFIYPLKSYIITSPFGSRWGSFHRGVDFAADYGVTIYAADGGIVTVSGWSGGYGYMVEIDHQDGRVTRYAHCSDLLVSEGQEVGQGQPIAELGNSGNSTGPHVHFEISIDGTLVNPLDYLK